MNCRWLGRTASLAAAFALAVLCRADTITLRGSTIAVRATIERIETGRVFYVDHSGRTVYRSLDSVEHINFDDLPQLAAAAAEIDNDRYREALPHLMHALSAAQNDTQRLWIHAQLTRAHDLLGQYVQASGHFAAVVLLEDHNSWRSIEPISLPDEPTYAAAMEAMVNLRRAQAEVTQPQLVQVIQQMIQHVEPIHRRLQAAYDGPPIEPGSTISGILKDEIVLPDPSIVPATAPDEERQRASQPTPPLPQHNDAHADDIAQLLNAKQWEEAIAACERAIESSQKQGLAPLLHQYGLALLGAGRPREAAIKFTRCAILYRESPHASLSLIETAIVYRDFFDRPETASRLLDRARLAEAPHNREAVRKRIDEVRSTLTLAATEDR